MTMTEITIITDEKLASRTHAVGEGAAEELRDAIEQLTEQGFIVLHGRSYRTSVPNSYGPTYKVRAPYYVYDGDQIEMVDAMLESRSHGARIPMSLEVYGDVVPAGWRCFKRDSGALLIRPI
jgi:hypothetical protein